MRNTKTICANERSTRKKVKPLHFGSNISKITMKKMHWAYLIKLILAGKFDVCNGTIVYARSEGISNHLQHNNHAQNSKLQASSIGG